MAALDPNSERRIRELRQQIEDRPNDRNDLMAEIGAILGYTKSYICKLIGRAEQRLRAQGWSLGDE